LVQSVKSINRTEIEAAVRERKPTATEALSVGTSDSYVSSGEAASMADSAASVTAEPLYREALVNELARRVSEGTYSVPAEQIVEKLLETARSVRDAA
jgi:anti-sigma28 factor (negative regulator of flagellin synthesis)